MDRISKTIQNLPKRQRVGLLLIFALLMLLGIVLTAVPKRQEIRPKASDNRQEVRPLDTSSEPSPTPGGIITISDNFDGGSIDINKWRANYEEGKSRIEQKNGKLEIEFIGSSNAYRGAEAFTNQVFSGDFQATVDIARVSGGLQASDTHLIFREPWGWDNTLEFYIRMESSNSVRIFAVSKVNNNRNEVSNKVYNGLGPFTLRLSRTGSGAKWEIKENGSFVTFGELQSGIYPGIGVISLPSNSFNPNFPAVISTFDNFTMTGTLADMCMGKPTTDTFESNSLNSDMWHLWTRENSSVIQANGKLQTVITQWNEWSHARMVSKKWACGNFDVSVDFSQFTAGQGDTAVATLSVEDLGRGSAPGMSSAVYIEIEKFKDNRQTMGSNIRVNDIWGSGQGVNYPATTGRLRIKRSGNIITTYYDENGSWKKLVDYTNGFSGPVNILIGAGSWNPDHPTVSAVYDNFNLREPVPDPTFTPVPSITPTPSPTPQPTPPSGQEKYTIDVGDKQFLTFNIAPGATPQIRFKAQLSNLANKPQMFLKLRVKDELAFIKNPSEGGGGDSCNNPPVGSKDFNIPAQADGDVYKPVQDINGPPPGGGKAAAVSVDGWVSLDGVIPGRYYSFLLKGPKTRSVKVAEHVLLQPNQNTEIQDFDWTGKPIDPGDLPDPNNSMKQDCTVNSVDLSLITSRLGATDGDSLSIGDVNYDGIINGNDVSKVVNTLSTKPDDDL